jgi:hypothetical protein
MHSTPTSPTILEISAVATVTSVLPEINALRSEIEGSLRNFDFTQFDKLEQHTRALTHAHSRYRSSLPRETSTDLVTELTQVRDDLFDPERLKHVKTATGYRALASDVLTLCTVFNEEWAKVEGKTPFTLAELHRVGTLALELLSAVGLRVQGQVLTGEATLIRQKAFTLFLRADDDARRAVHYLRDKVGDGDRIAPSLYAGRTARRRGAEEVEPPPAPLPPAAPHTVPTAATPLAATAPIVIDSAAGLPIDNPFSA